MRTLNLIVLSLLLLSAGIASAQNAKKFYKTGEDFIAAGNYKDAVDQLTKAVDMEPDMDEAYLARAEAYENLDMLLEAAEDYDRASTFLNKKQEVFYSAGRLYYELEEYDKALDRLNQSIEIKRNFVEAYQVKVKVLLALERYEEAMREGEMALTLKETSGNFYNYGLVQVRMGNLESAVQKVKDKKLKDGWHVFGFLWTPEEYVFYVDGKETWRTTTPVVSQNRKYIILSLEVGEWAGKIQKAELPDKLLVDYVRVYSNENSASGK